jgi:hypothetical protein
MEHQEYEAASEAKQPPMGVGATAERLKALEDRIETDITSADKVVGEIEETIGELREYRSTALTESDTPSREMAIANYVKAAFKMQDFSRQLEHLAGSIQMLSYLHDNHEEQQL